ncbi:MULTISPECIES: hypothetical protein [unclassified Oceanispirochaeta]|uniref:hypothetical protein n=1 Tax=unclassified Oceanispirochaeta TaxID=2635722 RepID=UPI000E097123|nr:MULTISPECIES: hypothetical protein [unclassified Oceanispirochaeta]MBF9018845.1 hypothetical protein [Oceanispirochaeta sp. M2]NPD75333.1 hypothetical protein [Oceanispirochaeta sp. M1]RDG28825.1 hypothetical protein DV872_24880 [Oceanispirochaeta sp. M1]
MKLSHEVLSVAEWLQEQLNENPFGETGVTFTSHNGVIVYTDYQVRTKHKSMTTENGVYNGK